MSKFVYRVFDSPRQWRAWRSEGIGASDMPIILGYSPNKSRAELLLEKMGKVKPKELTAWFRQKCDDSEMEGLMNYNGTMSCDLIPKNIENVRSPELKASLDGISSDESVLFEHKLVDRITFGKIKKWKVDNPRPTLKGFWEAEDIHKAKSFVSQIVQILIVMGINKSKLKTIVLSLGSWNNVEDKFFIEFPYDDALIRFARMRASRHAVAAVKFLKEWKGEQLIDGEVDYGLGEG